MSQHEEHDLRRASRAEPPPRPRLAVALGGLVAVALCVALVLRLAAPRSARAPSGLAGLRLGAPRAEVEQRARMGLPSGARTTSGAGGEARVFLFDAEATCRLRFEAEVLSELDCRLAALGDADQEALRRRRLLVTLRKLYGDESSSTRAGGIERWEWRNARVVLALESPDSSGGTRIVNAKSAKAR